MFPNLFDMNQKDFPSTAQKSIWHASLYMAPFKVVIPENTFGFDADVISSGEEDFYRFMQNMYYNMYNTPDIFYIPTAPYDDYMQNRKNKLIGRKKVESRHQTDAKECTLRSIFQQSIMFYQKFFYEIGCIGTPNRKYIHLSPEEYETVLANLEMPKIKGEQRKRISSLENLGIIVTQTDTDVVITSEHFPMMFIGLYVLCNSKKDKYTYMNYLRCDYSSINQSEPSLSDVQRLLPQNLSEIIDKFNAYFSQKNAKIKFKPLSATTLGSRWKVIYTIKGKSVFGFYADINYLNLSLYFNDSKYISEIASQLEAENTALYHWYCNRIQERLCKCPKNRLVLLGSIRRRICGLMNRLDIENPTNIDFENSLKVLNIFEQVKLIS